MRAARRAIPPEEREWAGAEVVDRVASLPDLASPRTVLLFYAFGSEIPTRGLIERLARDRHRLALPVLHTEMRAVAYEPGAPLVATGYGPKQPVGGDTVLPRAVDVVVAPGLAFDRRGWRLGYGGGHFDAFLASMRDDALRVGIGFGPQIVDELPVEPHDQRLDLVVTDDVVVIRRRPPMQANRPIIETG